MPPDPIALLRHAHHPDDPATLAFAGVIARSLQESRQPLIRGLGESCFQRLLKACFSDLEWSNASGQIKAEAVATDRFEAIDEANTFDDYDEFDEIVALLLDHRASFAEQESWLAHAVASAAMGENHLWQDLGLPSRTVLSQLMRTHFPTLAAKNTGDMKWKKFFYRQLCERAGVPICKSPHCAECCDYAICFEPEDA